MHVVSAASRNFTVVDLFSGAGGMSYGFASHANFEVVYAVDAQQGKPSHGAGSLECNTTYTANIDLNVREADLSIYSPAQLLEDSGLREGEVDILSSGAPCTGFSRALPANHKRDDPRNNHIGRTALFVEALRPKILVMENVRELIHGRFSHHWRSLRRRLDEMGYTTHGQVYPLSEYGLPQRRERALIIAAKRPLQLRTLRDLWAGYAVTPECLTVRHSIGSLPRVAAGEVDENDAAHMSPRLRPLTLRRLRAIPRNGGSWMDLIGHPEQDELLTPAMKRIISERRVGSSYPDVYGRLSWDQPAVTIKRECSHVGNGRYSHPEQDRLCTVREMALLSGFPRSYRFAAKSLSNQYRHIGDACPPLISYQLAHVCNWILTGQRPDIHDCVLPNTTLSPHCIVEQEATAVHQATLSM